MRILRLCSCFALGLTAMLTAGCIFSSSEAGNDDGEAPPTYPERTTPENVIDKLELAYRSRDLEAYLDCLSDDFVFWLNPEDIQEDPCLPLCWGLATESAVHDSMFRQDSIVASLGISLEQYGAAVEVPGETPVDPTRWLYKESALVTVFLSPEPGDAAYQADCGAYFMLQVDPADTSATGEELWEISEWYDVGKWTNGRGPGDSPVPPVSWGMLKGVFLWGEP